MKQILIIYDDVNIGNMLEEVLIKNGYKVARAYSGTEALLSLSAFKPDLVLLDLMLPGLSGEEVLLKIQGIPVIIMSAKLDVDNKVNLLLGGAVDYVTKPFEVKELLARITVALRNVSTPKNTVLTFDDLRLDTMTHDVFAGEKEVKLTRTEYAILKLLMQNSNQVVTKSVLFDSISIDTPDCTENSLKIHIFNLRKKLSEISDKEYIDAVWGIGFKLKEKS